VAQREFQILFIDDNPAETHVMKRAWKNCDLVRSNVSVLLETVQVIAFLRGATYHENHIVPDLILLDYKMPTDGGVALAEIKGDPDFLHIPVVVLTGSDNPKDHLDAYRRHANCCFKKPLDLKDYDNLVCDIAETWLMRALLPRAVP
jgi:CheY-like chemotaxis protein